jgi:transposase
VGESGTRCRGVREIPDAPLGESGRAELVRLRAESKDDKSAIAELRMQVEFAKKVATWFAEGSQ